MRKLIERFSRSTPLTLLPRTKLPSTALIWTCVVLVCAGPGWARDPDSDPDLPHGGLTREAFVAAKSHSGGESMAAGDKDNNGELGDAAALSDRYDVLRYGLDLQIDPSDRSIAGSVIMVFSSRYDGLTEMVFDLRQTLTIESVAHMSGSLTFTHQGDSVVVDLPAPLAEGVIDSVVAVSLKKTNLSSGLSLQGHHDWA
jgi:hypothetical protein